MTGASVSVPEPSWWSRIHVSGWAEGPLISFDPSDNTDIVSSTVITQKQVVGMMQRLSVSSKNTASIPKSPEVARQAQELQKEMRRRRTSAKVAAIRSKMVEKIATKMAEQASTLSQDRGDENFASDDMQPAGSETWRRRQRRSSEYALQLQPPSELEQPAKWRMRDIAIG